MNTLIELQFNYKKSISGIIFVENEHTPIYILMFALDEYEKKR